jgi:hypothetical protein
VHRYLSAAIRDRWNRLVNVHTQSVHRRRRNGGGANQRPEFVTEVFPFVTGCIGVPKCGLDILGIQFALEQGY